MRPDRLILEGFRSHRAKTDVDFTGDRLLAVVGDTGAGKSSLLSALAFALYARAPEASSKQGLINDECDQLMVQLDFTIDGETWTVSRVRRRNSSNNVDDLKRAGTDSVVVAGAGPVTQRVTELLGLDFDQFCRAVVLPQGRFDQILLAGSTERANQLRTLLGVDHVEAAGTALADVIADVSHKLTTATTQRRALPGNPTVVQIAADSALTDAERRLAAVAAAAHAAEAPTATAVAARRLVEDLERHSPDTAAVVDAAAGLDALVGPAADLAHRRAETASEKQVASDEEAAARTELAEILDGHPTVTELTETAARLGAVAAALPGDLASAADAEAALAALPDAVDPVDAAIVAADAAAASAADAARRQVEEATTALSDAQTALTAAAEARTAAAAAEGERAEAGEAAVTAGTGDTETRLHEARAAVAVARQAYRDHEVANAVAVVCAAHAPGDACPVCGHMLDDTWSPPPVPAFDRSSIDNAEEAERLAEASLAEATRRQAALATKAEAAAAKCADAAAQAAAAEEAAALLLGEDPEASLIALTAAVANASTAAESARAASEACAAELKAAERAHAGAEATLAEQRRGAQLEVQRCAGVLETHRAAVISAGEEGTILDVDAVSALAAEVRRIVTDAHTAKARVDDAVERVSKATADLADLATEKDETINAPAARLAAAANAVLAEARAAHRDVAVADPQAPPTSDRLTDLDAPSGVADIAALAASATDRAAAVAELDAARTAETAAARVRAETADQEVAAALSEVGVQSLVALNELSGSLTVTVDQRRAERDQAGADVARAATLDAEIARLGPLAATLDVVRRSTTTAKFGAYLVATRQDQLLTEASARLFEISKGRFGFGADFEIVVPATGRKRQPTDLSGGERFQASLALALALVEIVTRGSGRLESVFIDEGFGSLDVASLDDALATLSKVATEGRLVVLISHLHRVADYVDSVLHVREDDLRGSDVHRLAGDELEAFLADDRRSGLSG